jgi:hypothetical protein
MGRWKVDGNDLELCAVARFGSIASVVRQVPLLKII